MKSWKWVNLLTLLGVLLFNYASPYGQQIGSVADQYDTLFKPADYAFLIWGAIYLALLGWVIFSFISSGIEKPVGSLFFLQGILNVSWIYLFANEMIFLSVFVMSALLVTLIVIYRRVKADLVGNRALLFPFSLYLGWISVATIANLFILFADYGIDQFLGLQEAGWTLIMLCVGAALGGIFLARLGDSVYPLVIVWAYVAIMVEQGNSPIIRLFAGGLAVLLFVGVVGKFLLGLSRLDIKLTSRENLENPATKVAGLTFIWVIL